MEVAVDGRTHLVELTPRAGMTQFIATIDDTARTVAVTRSGNSVTVVLGADRYQFDVVRGTPGVRRGEDAADGPARRDIPAPMPGLVVSTAVRPGDTVAPGRVVAAMEAMKMQMEIRAPAAGTRGRRPRARGRRSGSRCGPGDH